MIPLFLFGHRAWSNTAGSAHSLQQAAKGLEERFTRGWRQSWGLKACTLAPWAEQILNGSTTWLRGGI